MVVFCYLQRVPRAFFSRCFEIPPKTVLMVEPSEAGIMSKLKQLHQLLIHWAFSVNFSNSSASKN